MFGKKKKSSPKLTLSPSVQKADELRRNALKAGEAFTRINKAVLAAMSVATTKEEKAAVRKKYRGQMKDLKFKADMAYANYDAYLREKFYISNAFIETGEKYFDTDKGFITWLQKNEDKKTARLERNIRRRRA